MAKKKNGGKKEYIVGHDDPMFYEQSSMTYDEAVRTAKEEAEDGASYGDEGQADIYKVTLVATVKSGMQTTVTKMKE